MMEREETRNLETIPVGSLGIIPLRGCESLAQRVDQYLVRWRTQRESEHKDSLAFAGYQRDSYILKSKVPRFGSGEAKGVILESVRGTDLYLLVDVTNYSQTYSLCGHENHMSPDDHYQDLKRIIAAVGGKARRITVIMPFLYESRQHKRTARESLDCALALQELVKMGVDNIITFDAHDPRVQNSIPLNGFETVQASYQFIKNLLRTEPDLQIDSNHMMVISPAYACGNINRVLTTNLIYQPEELLKREWYVNCDMSKYVAYLIDTLNHDTSISDLLDPNDKIQAAVAKYKKGLALDNDD